MINAAQVCRAQQARAKGHRSYSWGRAGSLWIPRRKLHVGGINCAFTPAFASFGAGNDTPLDWVGASNLVSWHDWSLERSYNTNLYGTGTSPPTISTTGAIPLGLGLEVKIPTGLGGARGTAKFDVSYNNGTSWDDNGGVHYTTAATYPLIGTGTGVTLNFANSTYSDTNLWRLKQNAWNDQKNSYDWLEDSTPNNPVPKITALGTALQFATANGILLDNSGLAGVLAGGVDNDWTMFSVCKIDNLTPTSGLGMILCLCNTSGNQVQYIGFNTTPDWIAGKRDTGGTTAPTCNGGTPDTSVHVVEMVHSGTSTTILVDGTIVAGPTTQDLTTMTPLSTACIAGSFIGTANGNNAAISYYSMLTYNAALGTTERGEIRQRLKSPYGIA